MKSIRMLVVEDDATLLSSLERLYREVFRAQGFNSVTIELARDGKSAEDLARGGEQHPYDFVSLDVNLGSADITGLDILGAFKRFKSAWMVALLTGVETDSSLDKAVGREAAEQLRKRLRHDAYARFWAERLIVVEKPSARETEAQRNELLGNRLRDIASVYAAVSKQRYIFRPIEVDGLERMIRRKNEGQPQRERRKFVHTRSLHWQIRFNCGDIRTLPDRAGFKTIHKLLSMEGSESMSPEMARVIEPPSERTPAYEASPDPVAAFFEAQGIRWGELPDPKRQQLVQAALSFRFKRYVELRGFEDEEDIGATEADELERIRKELGPLADLAEVGYQRMKPSDRSTAPAEDEAVPVATAIAQGELHAGGGLYTRRQGGRGQDSAESMGFRARKKRLVDYLRENGFSDLAAHIEVHVQSTGSSWSYNPPPGVEWTTA